MSNFTVLEAAVLKAICHSDAQDGDALPLLLATAKVTNRDNTVVGFYTDFTLQPDNTSELADSRFRVASAFLEDMGEGLMLFWLRFENDLSKGCLEGMLSGDDFDLKDRDLADLRFTQLDPPLPPST